MYPSAYIDYLVHFHGDRDYFECHEILEEFWKEKPVNERDRTWVALIQIAVAMYHHRRDNFPGAEKMLSNALQFIEKKPENFKGLGLHNLKLVTLLQERLHAIKQKQPYQSINLPITDDALVSACNDRCNQCGFVWQSISDLTNKNLVHRHSMRDREPVIREREKQLTLRKQYKRNW
ncbi:DUF309 domain-containing protein [Bacillus sp. HMF5848]|uniref:DUF309 domain-containing protein n=1 Tax=Bacillus sp. HMF5848 TaxID=2495421 RepID=UPI000F7AA6E2|nr:DUF309 domain-containing protein [Bacillus sp. HMF5848]RSK27505.1 DUF309 domain-containing protein [Bacillus sp. HMF5848]